MSKARDFVENMRGVSSNIQTQIASKRSGDATINSANWLGADLELTKGGTGASTAGDARTNLGLVIGTTVLAPDGDGSSLTGIAAGVTKYLTPAIDTASYMVKEYEVVPTNFTPSGTWQCVDKSTLHVIDMASIDISGEYLEENTTVSTNHLFYDTLNIMADATITITSVGTVQGIAGVTGLAGSVAVSTEIVGITQAKLITAGAI